MQTETEWKWKKYYNATRSAKPSSLLVDALCFAEKGNALDLGAGALRDTKCLLANGFTVVAVDSSLFFKNEARGLKHKKFSATISPFDAYVFPKETFELINAQYSLPFNPPNTFERMFARLVRSLKDGGVFVGQFFGKNDSWNKPGSCMTFHSKEQAEKILGELTILSIEEEEKDERGALGEMKHWHVFHVIAQK